MRFEMLQRGGAKFYRRLACSGALVLICGGAWAQEVKMQDRIEYYDITGRTPEQLLKSMEENAPFIAYSGVQHFAVAEPYFNWYMTFTTSPQQCAIESYEVTVDVVYTLPRWIDQERGSRRLVEYWKEFEKNVWIHERGHGDIALATGIELAKVLAKVAPEENCDALGASTDQATKQLLKDRDGVQRDYDKQSRHGMLQGAYFDVAAAKGRRRR